MPTHFGRPIHTFLFFVAAASWIRVTGGEGQKLKLASGRTVFHIVGMIPYPGQNFVRGYTPALKEYLDREVGSLFNPPVNFTLRYEDAYDLQPFENPLENRRDFTFSYPNMAGCLEAEFRHNPLLTVRNIRGGVSGLNHYGGVVYVRDDRKDLQKITDLKDKIITASNFKLCQHQWRVFEERGVSLMADTAQVRFSSKGEDSLLLDVIDGLADAGFTRTDRIESQPAEVRDKLRILEPLPNVTLDGVHFPFETTSELYPEYALLAGQHVDWEVQREVVSALLKLRADSKECSAAGIQAFQPALSYGPARDLFEGLGLMNFDNSVKRWRCLRAEDMWEGISCPAGMFKRSREEVALGCQRQGMPCESGYECLCRPCKRGYEVDVRVLTEKSGEEEEERARQRQQQLLQELEEEVRTEQQQGSVQRALASDEEVCTMMQPCGKVRQRSTVTYRLDDNKLRHPPRTMSWRLREGSEVRSGNGSPLSGPDGAFLFTYEFSISSTASGVHILELFLDDEQVPASPVLLEVEPALCNAHSIPNDEGLCACAPGFVAFLGPQRCLRLSLLLAVLFGLLGGCAALYAAWGCLRQDHLAEDPEQAHVRARVRALRRLLRIQPEHGWFVPAEKQGWRYRYMLLRAQRVSLLKTKTLSDLAHLTLLLKFDAESVDYLATQFLMHGDHTISNLSSQELSPDVYDQKLSNLYQDTKIHWKLLCALIIDVSRQLLDPEREEQEASQSVCRDVSWSGVGSRSRSHRTRAAHIRPWPWSGKSSGASVEFSERGHAGVADDGYDMTNRILVPPADAKYCFEFFRDSVAKLQLWSQTDNFCQLKRQTQIFMDKLRLEMDEVYSNIVQEDGGAELIAFSWDGPRSRDDQLQGAGTQIHRQDHPMVRAVRADQDSLIEMHLQRFPSHSSTRTNSNPKRTNSVENRTGSDPNRTGSDPNRTGSDPNRTGSDPNRTEKRRGGRQLRAPSLLPLLPSLPPSFPLLLKRYASSSPCSPPHRMRSASCFEWPIPSIEEREGEGGGRREGARGGGYRGRGGGGAAPPPPPAIEVKHDAPTTTTAASLCVSPSSSPTSRSFPPCPPFLCPSSPPPRASSDRARTSAANPPSEDEEDRWESEREKRRREGRTCTCAGAAESEMGLSSAIIDVSTAHRISVGMAEKVATGAGNFAGGGETAAGMAQSIDGGAQREGSQELGSQELGSQEEPQGCPELVEEWCVEEGQYVEQLWLRARLLDPGFQAQVLQAFAPSLNPPAAHDQPSRPSLSLSLPPSLSPATRHDDTERHREEGGRRGEEGWWGGEESVRGRRDLRLVRGGIKTKKRMLDKVSEYAALLSSSGTLHLFLPLTAQILDPVRSSVLCPNPRAILEQARWLIKHGKEFGLPVVRAKNKFAAEDSSEYDGYRDLMLSVLYTGAGGLRIVGEIQLHDARMHPLKVKMHRLYKVKRAPCAASI